MAQEQIIAVVPGPGLIFGLMLVAAIVGGYAARWLHVPRVVGFLFAGVALREILWWVLNLSHDAAARHAFKLAIQPLDAIKDLALGLIFFMIGGVFERTRFRVVGARAWRIVSIQTLVTVALVFGGCGLAALITERGAGIGPLLVLAIFLAIAAVETAPAATAHVLQEYEAKGRMTDIILAITGLTSVLCIVGFQIVFLLLAATGAIQTVGGIEDRAWTALLVTTVGSVALGVALGSGMSILHAKLPLPETLLFFFALFILLGAGETWMWENRGVSYNFLLCALLSGAVFANIAIDAGRLEGSLRALASPILAGFFVLAGFSLHVAELVQIGWLGAAFLLCRSFGKLYGTRLGLSRLRERRRGEEHLGEALLCQASVVIGLAAFVQRYWESDLARTFATVTLGAVVIFELAGPLLLKRCAVRAGEVKAITLLRSSGVLTEGVPIWRLTLQSILQLIGVQPKEADVGPEGLQVRHIMRTNVQLIRAAATFDEVLHQIERSTYSHFPVVHDDGQFVGVIHFSDVRDVIYEPILSSLVTAVDLADADSSPVPMNLPLRELLDIFTRQNVAVLPVVEQTEEGKKIVIGIVEQRDLLRALHLTKNEK